MSIRAVIDGARSNEAFFFFFDVTGTGLRISTRARSTQPEKIKAIPSFVVKITRSRYLYIVRAGF